MWYNNNMLPLIIRHRKNGDRILVNGRDKKIKDLFIDMKLSLSKRNDALLAVKDNDVLMIFGIKKSDSLKKISFEDSETAIKITVLEE